jgi:hypothetical protein
MGGLQHGLLEVELEDVPNSELSERGLSFCDDKLNYMDRCVHLLGHLAFFRGTSTTLETRMGFVRDVCGTAQYHDTPYQASLEFRCYDGAYMEAGLSIRRNLGLVNVSGEPLQFCAGLRGSRPVEASACIYKMVQITKEF